MRTSLTWSSIAWAGARRSDARCLCCVVAASSSFITAVGPWKYLGDRQLSLCEWTGWACGLAGRLLGSCLPLARFSYEMPAFLPPLKEKEFNEVVVAGGARAEIALQVPLAEAPLRDALSRVASRHPGGKVLINLDLK